MERPLMFGRYLAAEGDARLMTMTQETNKLGKRSPLLEVNKRQTYPKRGPMVRQAEQKVGQLRHKHIRQCGRD